MPVSYIVGIYKEAIVLPVDTFLMTHPYGYAGGPHDYLSYRLSNSDLRTGRVWGQDEEGMEVWVPGARIYVELLEIAARKPSCAAVAVFDEDVNLGFCPRCADGACKPEVRQLHSWFPDANGSDETKWWRAEGLW